MPEDDGRQHTALLIMRRADSIARAALAATRRKQLARLAEALEMMANTPARTPEESTAKEAAIADLLRRNTAHSDTPPPV